MPGWREQKWTGVYLMERGLWRPLTEKLLKYGSNILRLYLDNTKPDESGQAALIIMHIEF